MTDLPQSRRRPTLPASTYAWLAVGVAIFTIYGSFIPFQIKHRTLDDAAHAFGWVLNHRFQIESRSDFIANVLLGVPLGFCLLATLRVDKRRDRAKTALCAVALWPWCVAFAACVEFGQLFFVERTCSASDILAQGLGSATGMAVWAALGQQATDWFRAAWLSPAVGGTPGRLALAYLAILGIVLLLPLDLTLSPADIARKFRGGKVFYFPFEELTRPGGPRLWVKVQNWLELAGLYLPVGMLAAGLPGRWQKGAWTPGVLAAGFLTAFGYEVAQLFVNSRTSSATDVLIGGTAVLLGWLIVKVLLPRHSGRGLSLDAGLILGQLWLAVLLIMNWQPFDFDRDLGAVQLAKVNWVPFAIAYEKMYLHSLEEAGVKTILFAAFGVIVAAAGRFDPTWRRLALGGVVAVVAATIIEVGQLFLPSRTAGPTDLIFAAIGGTFGTSAVNRLRLYGFGPTAAATPVEVTIVSIQEPLMLQLANSSDLWKGIE